MNRIQQKIKYTEIIHDAYEDDIKKHYIDVGFLIIATGNYTIFLDNLIDSIEKFVLPNSRKYYNIFSDKDVVLSISNYKVHKIEHKPFPYPTLNRFDFFCRYANKIVGDQLVYIDADTLVTNYIGTEILTPRTVTQHCGFTKVRGTFESRPQSYCYVEKSYIGPYFGGGFYSFERREFFNLSAACLNMIRLDAGNNIVPIWHDESALNKYMIIVPPTRILSPSYHYPENHESIYRLWGGEDTYTRKIMLLNKNHAGIRECE